MEEKKGLLAKCAATTLSSKLIGGEKEFFATMVVDAVMAIGDDDRLNLIGIKKVKDSFFFFFLFTMYLRPNLCYLLFIRKIKLSPLMILTWLCQIPNSNSLFVVPMDNN